jgi:hypothetical protein
MKLSEVNYNQCIAKGLTFPRLQQHEDGRKEHKAKDTETPPYPDFSSFAITL